MPANNDVGAFKASLHGDGRRAGRVKATYRDNYARLAQIKKQYDPDNFFRVNQNVEPAG
jgi:FAD/FMN-containing dehydrogenase